MSNFTIDGIVGTDGIVPIYDPNGIWRIWAKNDIYFGSIGKGKYVPKINDYVIEPLTYETWLVLEIDPITAIPTLGVIRPAGSVQVNIAQELLFGNTITSFMRAYINTGVLPNTLAVESRALVCGSMYSYAKIYKGSDVIDETKCISRLYNANNELVSTAIPLESVAIDNTTTFSVKKVKVCNCLESFVDGERLTLVYFSDSGHVLEKFPLIVENTGFVRTRTTGVKYITHVSLDSPYISLEDTNTIEMPIGTPLSSLTLFGAVHYSDGSSNRLPVDGTRFSIKGLDQYVSTIEGVNLGGLVLVYNPSSDEAAYSNSTADGTGVVAKYNIRTVALNPSYAVKLYGYPIWKNLNDGYQFKWWLYSLDRNTSTDVTDYVRFDPNKGDYDPVSYGDIQRRSVSITLSDISPAYRNYRHVQAIELTLNTPPNARLSPWSISLEAGGGRKRYGNDNIAILRAGVMSRTLDISIGCTSVTEWLSKTYDLTYPLEDTANGTKTPLPTHVVISNTTGTSSYEVDIGSALKPFSVDLNDWKVTDVVVVKFVKKTLTGNLHLSMIVMPIAE